MGKLKTHSRLLAALLAAAAPAVWGKIYLPPVFGEAKTPETRTRTAEEEAKAQTRDWLFQAMGESLAQRTAKEIAWVDACCPYNGEEEIRAIDDPDFPGIATLTIRPRVKTAPVIARP